MAEQGTLEGIALALARLFQPLREELEKGRVRVLFAELGMEFPPELETKTAFINALQTAVTNTSQFPVLIADLIKAIKDEDVSAIISKGKELLNVVKSLVENIEEIAEELKNLGGTLPGISAAQLNAFATDLPKKIIDYLIVKTLEGTPGMVETLQFINFVEKEEVTSGGFNYIKRTINFDQFTNFIKSPADHFKTLYDWGKPSFDGAKLFQKAETLLSNSGIPAIYDPAASPKVLDLMFLELSPKTDINPNGLLLKILEKITVENDEFSMDDWKVKFSLDTQLGLGVQIVVQPDGAITFIPPSGELKGDGEVEWIAGDTNGEPFVIIGEPDGSRLEAKQFSIKAGAGFAWNTVTDKAEGSFKIGGAVSGGKLKIDFSQGDGFLSEILSGVKLESDFDIGFGFSNNEGVYFVGSSTLEIQLPIHIDLGPIDIDALTFSVGINGNQFPIGISSNIKAELGPLVAVVEQIGITANLSIPENGTEGNLGPVNFELGFKPPSGVGLSIDAGVVKGGGYLFFDFDKGEYAGALELTFSEIVSLKAIGLITTKMPDGSDGFSMIIIITAEFGTGIQLGFGFTLLGVGGLLGLNRTMRLDALAEGVRTGATESIMFPTNVVENAPKIISDLRNFFPVEEGKFLIGPMAKLGWGTPTLISISLGIIIEIPGNIAILGILKIALPTEEAALIVLQVNFIGAIEFDKDRLWFFASMYDSRVLFITLEGEMGLLVGWGSDSNFVSAVGGFHPAFNPPPLPFPNPVRISLNILNESWGRIRVMAYFAVTSNTAQFGARAELYFGFSALNVEGHIGFDALFQFSPFYMIISLSASLSVKVFGIGLFSVKVKMSLEGPSPWHANGTGSISLLFFDIDVDFDFTWGEEKDTELPPISVMPILVAEYEKQENWKALVPANNTLFVTLREIDDVAELVLHPVGSLEVTQRAVPLELTLDKVGTQKPDDANHFTLTTADNELAKIKDIDEKFAIAQYKDLKDGEKLSSPSYQPIEGGMELSVEGEQLATGKSVKRHIRYELITIDTNYKRGFNTFFNFITSIFNIFLRGNAVARAEISNANLKKVQPFDIKIKVQEPGFSVASMVDNSQFGNKTFKSQAQAMEFAKSQISANPALQGALHVIPNHEINTAA